MSLTQIALNLISGLGYAGLFLGLVIDSFGIPIPSEVLIPVATVLAIQGRYNWIVIFLIGVGAQVTGGLIAYTIGRYGGEPFLEKYGKYVLISKHDLERTHDAFAKYGTLITMVGRCLPVIRGLVGYPAGIAKMDVGKYVIFTAIGSAFWTAILMGLGVLLQHNLELIDQVMRKFSLVVIVLLVIAVIYHFRHLLDRSKKAE